MKIKFIYTIFLYDSYDIEIYWCNTGKYGCLEVGGLDSSSSCLVLNPGVIGDLHDGVI